MSLVLKDARLLQSGAYIAGEFVASDSGETFPVLNPADQSAVADVAKCGATECLRAIDAAHAAQKDWAQKTVIERSNILSRFCELMLANKEDLAEILSAEQGKPLAEAEGEVAYGASYVRWFAEEARRIYGDVIPTATNDARHVCVKQPVGVVGCITPWNFPNAMLARKIAPALAAGCSVVCKPANETPLSALALGELANRAGIPAGVINILGGYTSEIGEAITSSEKVRKLTFTGSTPVGKKLAADCTTTMKRVSMELGGNAPFIVFESADLPSAIAGLVANKFRNAGQTCVCTNRILIQSSIAGEFKRLLLEAMAELKVGNGSDADTKIGPLINERAVRDVQSLIEDARSGGAEVIEVATHDQEVGSFLSPTMVADATSDMRIFHEEIFGPVAAIFEFASEQEAIELANATPFGLAAYFYSNNHSQIWRVGEALEAGMIGVNDAAISSEMIPFGGVKESGQGREGSKYGLDDYLEIKYLKMAGI